MKYALLLILFLPVNDVLAQFRTDSLKHSPRNFDENLFWDINHSADTSAFLDGAMLFASKSLLPVAIAVPSFEAGRGVATGDDNYFYDAASIGAGTIATVLFQEVFVKPIVRRNRPYISLDGVRWIDSSAHGYSFPSSHAAISFGLATALALRYPKPSVIIPSFAYAFIVSISRPYLGVHYPSDILCGAIIGSGIQYIAYVIEQASLPKLKGPIVFVNKVGHPVRITLSLPIH